MIWRGNKLTLTFFRNVSLVTDEAVSDRRYEIKMQRNVDRCTLNQYVGVNCCAMWGVMNVFYCIFAYL